MRPNKLETCDTHKDSSNLEYQGPQLQPARQPASRRREIARPAGPERGSARLREERPSAPSVSALRAAPRSTRAARRTTDYP
ncbi:hypothetical protein J2Y66_000740 [Paenarthrobacter nitroguajacolicus]|nr:hypothetical protein [Paenarthrobacter nitroguajacolicus]